MCANDFPLWKPTENPFEALIRLMPSIWKVGAFQPVQGNVNNHGAERIGLTGIPSEVSHVMDDYGIILAISSILILLHNFHEKYSFSIAK